MLYYTTGYTKPAMPQTSCNVNGRLLRPLLNLSTTKAQLQPRPLLPRLSANTSTATMALRHPVLPTSRRHDIHGVVLASILMYGVVFARVRAVFYRTGWVNSDTEISAVSEDLNS